MDLERRGRGIKRSSVLSTRGKKWFFPPGRRADGKKKKPKSVHGEDEGGQARVTRRIEYLRGTPFAWKIERCSSIKGASYTRRKITKPRKEFVRRFCCFLSLSFSLFSLSPSTSISNCLVVDEDKQFFLACSFVQHRAK